MQLIEDSDDTRTRYINYIIPAEANSKLRYCMCMQLKDSHKYITPAEATEILYVYAAKGQHKYIIPAEATEILYVYAAKGQHKYIIPAEATEILYVHAAKG